MLGAQQIKNIENRLDDLAAVFYDTRNAEVKERNRGYCQGIAYTLGLIGYEIKWNDNGRKSTVQQCQD